MHAHALHIDARSRKHGEVIYPRAHFWNGDVLYIRYDTHYHSIHRAMSHQQKRYQIYIPRKQYMPTTHPTSSHYNDIEYAATNGRTVASRPRQDQDHESRYKKLDFPH